MTKHRQSQILEAPAQTTEEENWDKRRKEQGSEGVQTLNPQPQKPKS